MKKVVLSLILLYSVLVSLSNTAPTSNAFVSELYFDSDGNWTVELYFTYYDSNTDTGYVMITPTDTAFFKKFPDSTNIVLLTMADLSKKILLDKEGDFFWFENWIEDMEFGLTWPFVYGNHPDSWVNELYSGQSYIGLGSTNIYWEHRAVKDTSSSLGEIRNPPKGIFKGNIYDSTGIPLPYIRVQTFGIEAKTLWPDENGFFTDTLFAKNYSIFIYNGNPNKIYSNSFTIEPDSTTTHEIYLPVSAEIEFTGMCYLSENNYHSNTTIYLEPQCPFAPIDTLTTDSTGYYSKSIKIGHYNLRYSHENYIPWYTYWYKDFFYQNLLSPITLEEGNVHEIGDTLVAGHWINDYPYWIFCDLHIVEDDSLIIDPGVEVIFRRNRHWNIRGTLIAEGESIDTISITSSQGNWGPFNLINGTSSNSLLKFLEFKSLNDLNVYNSDPVISNTVFSWNNAVCVYENAAPLINECLFQASWFNCRDSSAPILNRNIFTTSIFCGNYSSPKIFNNNFLGFWKAIYIGENVVPDIRNNSFNNGGVAVFWDYGDNPTIENLSNNCFFNVDQIVYDPSIVPGIGILDTVNINSDSCDIYFNLMMDPLFTDPDNGDFSLLPDSPCIDAGNPEFEFDPDSTIADIGALYFDQTGVFINNQKHENPEIKIYHYPNPASDFVNFVIEGDGMSKIQNTSIKIFNFSGILVGEFVCPSISNGFGKNIFRFQTEDLKSGTYLYSFIANGTVLATKKMILIK